jgi:hypothetical protein
MWWCWILFAVLLVWYVASTRFTAKREMNLESYAIFLLLSDDILADQRAKFKKWIVEAKETRADQLRLRAGNVVRYAAERLGETGSLLQSAAFVQNQKKQSLELSRP